MHNPVLPEMLEESADARENLSGPIPRRARTRAGRAVSLKRPEGFFVELLQIAILELEPDTEVGSVARQAVISGRSLTGRHPGPRGRLPAAEIKSESPSKSGAHGTPIVEYLSGEGWRNGPA